MKKIILGLIATIMIGNLTFGQSKISFLDIKNKEIAIIIDNKNNSFKEYYLFQYDNQDFSNLSNKELFGNVKLSENNLIISSNNIEYIFTISENRNGEKYIFNGYGLSHRIGDFSIGKNINPEFIYNAIFNKALGGDLFDGGSVSITCHSGGPGATSCSVKASSISVGTAECSVSCSAGFYACCDDTKGECRCVANPKK